MSCQAYLLHSWVCVWCQLAFVFQSFLALLYQRIIFCDRDIWQVQITVVKLFSHVEYRKNKIKVFYWTQVWKRESQILFYFFLEGQNYFWGWWLNAGKKKRTIINRSFKSAKKLISGLKFDKYSTFFRF